MSNTRRNVTALALNLLFLAGMAAVFYYRHSVYIFEGFDGQYALLRIQQYFQWHDSALKMSWYPLQGMGFLSEFEGISTLPALVFMSNLPLRAQMIAYFVICTLLLFLATYSLQCAFGITTRQSLCGAWVCVLCVFPLQFQPVPLGPTYAYLPFFSYLFALSIFVLTFFRLAGRGPGVGNWLTSLAFVGFTAVTIHASFSNFAFSAPLVLLGGLFILLASEDKREARWKIVLLLLTAIILAGTGLLTWMVGEVMQSARFSLTAEIMDIPPTLTRVSLLFHNARGPWIIIPLSIAGAFFMLRDTRRAIRFAGQFLLTYFVIMAVVAYCYLKPYDFRAQLRPLYYEFGILPFYALAAAYAVSRLWTAAARRWRRLDVPFPSRRALLLAGLIYLAISAIGTFFFRKDKFPPPGLDHTAITEHLVRETALPPGGAFRGRTAWLTAPEQPTITQALQDPDAAFLASRLSAGQLLAERDAGMLFTKLGIPTLEIYTSSLSLPFYLLFSRCASTAPWGYNHTYFSRLNTSLLAAAGVRFVMSASQFSAPGASLAAHEAAHENTPATYLYELASPNLGGYSPVEYALAPTINEALDLLTDKDFNFARRVVLHRPLPNGTALTPGKFVSLTVEPSGIRIQAHSQGTSLLLLPFEFRNSMRWIPDNTGLSQAQPLRANLAMTGLLFSGAVSGLLECAPSPASAGFSSLQTLLDMRDMDLKGLRRRDLSGADAYVR